MLEQNSAAKPYTTKQLADLYGVSLKTLRKWLKPYREEIGQRNGHFYTCKQVETIFNSIGLPPEKKSY